MSKRHKVSDDVQITGDFKNKQMILTLDPQKHSWVKNIAQATGMSQPNVVNLILSEATKAHADDYIEQIKKMHANEALKKLQAEATANEAEQKRLKQLLDS